MSRHLNTAEKMGKENKTPGKRGRGKYPLVLGGEVKYLGGNEGRNGGERHEWWVGHEDDGDIRDGSTAYVKPDTLLQETGFVTMIGV